MHKEVLKKDNMVDLLHMTQISELTGEVTEWTQPVFTPEHNLKILKVIENKKNKEELAMYIEETIGSYFHYFYEKAKSLNIESQYKTRLLYLATFVTYDGGYLKDDSTNEILTKVDIQNKLKLGKSEFYNTINALLESGVLIEDKQYYRINTDYVIMGTVGKKKHYTRIFIDSIREVYEKSHVRNHKSLYFLFVLLPYINLQHNIFCSNPDEEEIVDVKPLYIRDMCDIVGYDKTSSNKLWNMLLNLRINGQYVICKTIRKELEVICINPRLYYKGTRIKDLQFVVGIFSM